MSLNASWTGRHVDAVIVRVKPLGESVPITRTPERPSVVREALRNAVRFLSEAVGSSMLRRTSPGCRVVVQTLEVEPIRGLEVTLDHAASTAFQISGAVLCLTRSLSSLN
jgi:hypothetical protein